MRSLLCLLTLGLLLGAGSVAAQPVLQARIDAAAAGDTLVVDGGTYDGALVIDRPLILIGRDRPHVRGSDEGHVIEVRANDVTIEGLRISGSGTSLDADHAGILIQGNRVTVRDNRLDDVLHGIYVKGYNRAVIVENVIDGPPVVTRRMSPEEARRNDCSVPPEGGSCEVPLPEAQRGNGIHLWKSTHNTIAHNTIRRVRDGVYFSFADHTYAAHNTIHDVRYGLHFMYSDDNTFEHNLFYDNASGSALMFSYRLTARHNVFHDNRTQRGYGLLLQTMDDSRFVNNRMTRNGTGVYLENSTGNTFKQNVIAANFRGFRMTGSSMDNRFGSNVIRGNLNIATVAGMSATNAWQIDGVGNYWGPRGLLDLDSDGISELPRRTLDVMGKRREAFPYVDLLAGSPGLTLLTEALRRVSVPGVPTITDDRPLMRPSVSLDHAATDRIGHAFAITLLIGAAGTILLRRYRDD